MKYHYIVDKHAKTRRKRHIRKLQACDMISKMSLALGDLGNHYKFYDEIKAKGFWQFDGILPARSELWVDIRLKNIKWYIKNHIPNQDPIWNGSYLHGVCQFGKIIEPKYVSGGANFPSFTWWSSKKVMEIVKLAPFGGRIISNPSDYMKWGRVPALLLPYDENDLSFMAGVLSVGRLGIVKGEAYAIYNVRCERWFRKWGIPIEFKQKGVEFGISPLWPCLLERYMPLEVRGWSNIRNAKNASMYAAILWRIYRDEEFKSGEIPYLLGRRSIFYNYGSETLGAMKNLEFMRFEKGLTQLDDRFRSLIQNFSAV